MFLHAPIHPFLSWRDLSYGVRMVVGLIRENLEAAQAGSLERAWAASLTRDGPCKKRQVEA